MEHPPRDRRPDEPPAPRRRGLPEGGGRPARARPEIEAHTDGPFTAAALADHDVLVLAHPSDGTWERVTGIGSAKLSADEIDVVEAFVRAGGGLVVMTECEQDKYGNNVADLLARFGVRPVHLTVQDTEHNHNGVVAWVRAVRDARARPNQRVGASRGRVLLPLGCAVDHQSGRRCAGEHVKLGRPSLTSHWR